LLGKKGKGAVGMNVEEINQPNYIWGKVDEFSKEFPELPKVLIVELIMKEINQISIEHYVRNEIHRIFIEAGID
jgi:hypothetical protein